VAESKPLNSQALASEVLERHWNISEKLARTNLGMSRITWRVGITSGSPNRKRAAFLSQFGRRDYFTSCDYVFKGNAPRLQFLN
jgi:hypothetical protein